MIFLLFKDPWTYIASLGTAFLLSIQWVAQNLTPLAAFIGAIMTVGILVVGFRSKIKEYKNMEQERINLLLENEIKRMELEELKRHLK